MTCLSESTIVSLLERGLPNGQRAEIDAHLDACASCRQVVVDLTAVVTGSSMAAEDHTTHPARSSAHGPALELGAMVGRFVVLDRIGRGGMGTVYTAHDPELDRYIALKLLHHQARTVDDARVRILAEAQAMARISHPGVVAIYEVGTFRDRVFAAMELVEGTTLRAWITEQPRRWREVVAVFLLAGEGLAAAHAAGVVHRDFKPENVLLGRDGRVKVSDFGLSSLSPAGDGAVAGTPGYLPVEALRGEAVDHRADQFAFCIALYEALHGRRPFSARAADDLAAEVRRGPVFDRHTRGVPKPLDQILRRGLALEPDDRFASMRALLDALRRTVSRRSGLRSVAAARRSPSRPLGQCPRPSHRLCGRRRVDISGDLPDDRDPEDDTHGSRRPQALSRHSSGRFALTDRWWAAAVAVRVPAGSRMTSDELETTSRSTSSNTLTVSRCIQAFHGATEK